MELLAAVLLFLEENAIVLGGGAATLAIVETVFSPFRTFARRWKKPDKVELVNTGALQSVSSQVADAEPSFTVPQFLKIQRQLKEDAEAELQTADTKGQDQLRAKIAELESRIANPEQALEVAQKRIAELEALLERSGNDIGGDRIAAARAALERGDYSIADDLFAEIEGRRELEVQEAARAATGRGEIAEAEVRWGDAAEHYTRAARLDPTYDTLIHAGDLLWRAGRHNDAIWHEEHLVKIAKQEFGAEHEKTGIALNNLAESYKASGRYGEAEPLYREALEIARKGLGTDHPNYGGGLNNLAGLLRATGRYEEAEPLYREAVAVIEAALGGGASGQSEVAGEFAAVSGRAGEVSGRFRLP